MKKRRMSSNAIFAEIEKVSGLIVRKSWSLGAAKIFIVLEHDVPAPPLPTGFNESNPAEVANAIVGCFETMLKPKREVDLESGVRYAMKEAAMKFMLVKSTDDLRLVQAETQCFIFRNDAVKKFHKTDKGYSWTWVK